MKLNIAIAVICLPAITACSATEFDCNCDGDPVTNCLPYEYSIIESFTVMPDEAPIDDVSARVQIRIQFAKCEQAPRAHELTLRMRVGQEESAEILDLLTFRDDGMTEGDEIAGDGIVDVDITTPFLGPRIPENTDVFLRVEARMPADCSGMCFGGTCRSEVFEIPYRTGTRPPEM